MKRYDYITPIDDKRYETLTLSCIVNDSKLNPDSIL